MSTEHKTSITFAIDGPCLVKQLKRLSNQHGPITTTETIALCRCGASSSKPFCDGSHAKTGFSSAKQGDRLADKRESYQGKKITIHDNRCICAHAGICTDKLSAVFRMKQEPWIDPDAASVEAIISVIDNCPSGALSYSIDTKERAEKNSRAAIFIAPNGPYVVSGEVSMEETGAGEGAAKQQFTLCRCGASKNKPFCDGSHWSSEFTDDTN